MMKEAGQESKIPSYLEDHPQLGYVVNIHL